MCHKANGQPWKPNDKQQRFISAYAGNASEAAREAGYSNPGQTGCRLLKNAHIAKRIKKAQAKRAERTQVTVDRVVIELAKIAFSNAGDYFTWGPDGVTLNPSADLTTEQKAAVSEASETVTEAGGTIRVKLHDKVAALEKLGKYLGMFIDRTELSGFISQFPDAVNNCTPEEKRIIAGILRNHE